MRATGDWPSAALANSPAGETGVLTWAAAFAIVYLVSLLATTVFVIVGALCVAVVGDLIEGIFGLGG